MTMRAIIALIAAVLTGGFAPASAAQAAERLRLTYAVYVGGFLAMEGNVALTMAANSYDIQLEAETKGLPSYVISWRAEASSRGARSGAELLPQQHDTLNQWRGKLRSVTMRYDSARNALAKTAPPPAEDDRDLPSPDQVRATLDPLSAFVDTVEGLRRSGGCQRVIAAFDGRRRFDLRFRDMGDELPPDAGYVALKGAARRCVLEYLPIAGYKRTAEPNIFWRGPSGERPPIIIWFAPVTLGGPPVPVRVESSTPLGAVVAHLTGAESPPP